MDNINLEYAINIGDENTGNLFVEYEINFHI